MRLFVKQNTLNVRAPKYNLYYTTKEITETELGELNAEKSHQRRPSDGNSLRVKPLTLVLKAKNRFFSRAA